MWKWWRCQSLLSAGRSNRNLCRISGCGCCGSKIASLERGVMMTGDGDCVVICAAGGCDNDDDVDGGEDDIAIMVIMMAW